MSSQEQEEITADDASEKVDKQDGDKEEALLALPKGCKVTGMSP